MKTRSVFALAAFAAAAIACSEEDRRAWVSILPEMGSDEAPTAAEGGPFRVTADSTAVMLGPDTLFTVARVPASSGGSALQPARIATATISPDSTAIAMKLVGPTSAILIWSRARQTAVVVRTFPGGEVVTLAWSPGGRLLAFEGRDAAGTPRAGVFDAEAGLNGRHAVLRWLERQDRSVRFQSWIGAGRARLLVGPSPAPEGGLTYIWDIPSGTFMLEAHTMELAAQAPAGSPQRGGIFSVDLGGDPSPESVALYRAADGSPGAFVLVDAGPGGVRGTATEPLLPATAVGFEEWKEATVGPELYRFAEVGGRTTILLILPSLSPFVAIGLFQLGPGGKLEPVPMMTPNGLAPAILPDGIVGDESKQLGIVDLDGDGAAEVVTASGVRDPAAGTIRWSADVFRWEGGRLVLAPGLVPAAMERMERLRESG